MGKGSVYVAREENLYPSKTRYRPETTSKYIGGGMTDDTKKTIEELCLIFLFILALPWFAKFIFDYFFWVWNIP